MSYLETMVLEKIGALGEDSAADFFSVKKSAIGGWLAGTQRIPIAALEAVWPAGDPRTYVQNAQLQKAEWEGKKVAILLPWYKTTNPVTAFCVAGLIDRAKVSVILNFNDAMISHSRNFLATQFLQTGIEWCFSLDDDMVVPWGNGEWFNKMTGFKLDDKFAGQNILNRLLSHNKTVIGALYFGRHPEGQPMYAEGWGNARENAKCRQAPYDLISETKWVGTGAMLVHRKVFLDIEAKYPALARVEAQPGKWYSPSEHDLVGAATAAMAVLQDSTASPESRVRESARILQEGKNSAAKNSVLGMGEDVQFCFRAAQAGHPVHVDFGALAGHIGYAVYGPRNTKNL